MPLIGSLVLKLVRYSRFSFLSLKWTSDDLPESTPALHSLPSILDDLENLVEPLKYFFCKLDPLFLSTILKNNFFIYFSQTNLHPFFSLHTAFLRFSILPNWTNWKLIGIYDFKYSCFINFSISKHKIIGFYGPFNFLTNPKQIWE